MSGDLGTSVGEVRLDPDSIEAIARRLAALLRGAETGYPRRKLLSAEEVSRWWGVSRRWVYDHAERLGARRIGTGSRPRLRFDPDEVAERLGEPHDRHEAQRLPAISSECRSDSLSSRTRANVGCADNRLPGESDSRSWRS